MDSVDDLSSLLACTHYLHMGLRCGPSALWPRSRALQTSSLPRADCRACTAYSGSGKWVFFTGQPRTAQEYKGQGSKVPLYLGVDRRLASLLSSKDGLGFGMLEGCGGYTGSV